MKNILIIAPFAFGYTKHIQEAICHNEGVKAAILYLDRPVFVYKNKLHRIQNSFSKLILGKNLKKTFVSRRILSALAQMGKQDIIFMIRPDMLDDNTLYRIKSYTSKFIAYYWDSTRRFPRKIDLLPIFDEVYSYDREDVKTYRLKFLTNYIFKETPAKTSYDYLFFNISTHDFRLPILEKVTQYIDEQGWSRTILVYNGSPMETNHVTLITQQKSIKEVAQLISKSKIIVEIQRGDQIGLSFRVFEALGQRKKLITTNKDIVHYDFYHPQNILVLDEHNIQIPEAFVSSPYVDIDDAILDQYRIANWVKPVFYLE